MASQTRTVTIGGDTLTVSYDGRMWVGGAAQAQYATAREAMAQEVLEYLRSCGEDAGDDRVSSIVDGME